MQLVEPAPAKINLTLRVLGRRPDGYHEIESLVAFADVADRLTLSLGAEPRVTVHGPFAGEIEGENLLARALALLAETDAGLRLGAADLEKSLPVAAGLGGGSADAAALLRAVARANPDRAGAIPWHRLALRLGADVPVCLASRPALIWGIGDRLELLEGPLRLPAVAAVLVNPRRPLATAEVFRALGAAAAPERRSPPALPGPFADVRALARFVRAGGNDLGRPATALMPAIAHMQAAVAGQPGCLAATLSGSGPTCVGIFEDGGRARQAADALASAMPGWWVRATTLGGAAVAPVSWPD